MRALRDIWALSGPGKTPKAARPSLRVLIVDDERSVADSLGLIVAGRAHVVRVAYSGEQAAMIADQLQPEAVISDVMMPGMDGFELEAWIQEHQPECSVLLITGHIDCVDLAEQHVSCGHVRSVLSKPFHPREVLNSLEACVHERSNR